MLTTLGALADISLSVGSAFDKYYLKLISTFLKKSSQWYQAGELNDIETIIDSLLSQVLQLEDTTLLGFLHHTCQSL